MTVVELQLQRVVNRVVGQLGNLQRVCRKKVISLHIAVREATSIAARNRSRSLCSLAWVTRCGHSLQPCSLACLEFVGGLCKAICQALRDLPCTIAVLHETVLGGLLLHPLRQPAALLAQICNFVKQQLPLRLLLEQLFAGT